MAFLTPSTNGTSGGGDAVYVAAVPLKAAAGPPQLVMSMAYSLNLRNLQHFMVLIKPSSPIRQEVSTLLRKNILLTTMCLYKFLNEKTYVTKSVLWIFFFSFFFQVIVFDFQPVNPESIESAISILSGKLIPGSDSQTVISNCNL